MDSIKSVSLFFRILQSADLDEVLEFEQKKLLELVTDDNERTFQSWSARWRKESLEHYLNLGWSFIARDREMPSAHSDEGLIVGYFIAQPFLFLEGNTQTLWVEHLAYSSLQARDSLCELACKLSREKHFQQVLFPNNSGVANSVAVFKAEPWQTQALRVKTTK